MMGNIKFYKEPKEAEIRRKTTLLRLAHEADAGVKAPCAGRGVCGKCLIKVKSGDLPEPSEQEIKVLGEEKIKEGYRMSCLVEVDEDCEVEVYV